MKYLSLALLVITLFAVILTSCSKSISTPIRDSNFNFIFKHGVYGANILDTFQNTYTKDMVPDPPVTANMYFTQEDMDMIYQKMKDIGFFNYPTDFNDRIPAGSPIGIVTPSSSYYFKVEFDKKVKELTWYAGRVYQDDMAKDLESLINLITQIIYSKDEYKRMPTPTSVYINVIQPEWFWETL